MGALAISPTLDEKLTLGSPVLLLSLENTGKSSEPGGLDTGQRVEVI